MKRFGSILLVVALAYQCLGTLGIFVWYGTNKQAIAQELCVNRARPELHCNGQCVLMKKLKSLEQNQHEQKTNSTGQKTPGAELTVFLIPDFPGLAVWATERTTHHPMLTVRYHYRYAPSNDKPPA